MTAPTLTQEVSRRAGWSIFMGVLTAAVGLVMILYPLPAAAAATVFFGSLLIVASVAQFVFAFASPTVGSFVAKILLGILYGVAGIALVGFPGAGVVTLTGVLGTMLIVEAVLETVVAFSLPPHTGRGWFFFSALTSLLLGGMILAEWPISSVWAIGTMLGVAVLMNGITRIVVSSQVRTAARGVERTFKAA